MSLKDCLNEIRDSFGGALSDEHILEALEEFDAVARATVEQKPWASIQEELFGHAGRRARVLREEELIRRRNQLGNNRKEAALRGILDRPEWAKDPTAGAVAKDVGSLGFAAGGKLSVFRQGGALAKNWLGSLINALDKRELTTAIKKGDLDEQIAAEMWEMDRKGGKSGVSGSKEALVAGKIIHRLNEVMVGRLNRAGAYIRRTPGYVIRQSYDARRIGAAKFEKWFADTWPRIDEMRTFNRLLASDEREAIYAKLFNDFANGRHPSVLEDTPWQSYQPGGGNMAKRVSQHRELHFKTAKDWYANHVAYGAGTILENVQKAIIANGRAAVIMETYGSNPKEMHQRFFEEANARASAVGAKTSGQSNRLSPDNLWGIISGESARPSDASLARIGNAARSLQVASKLGSAVMSAYLTDPALQFNEMSRHGVGFLRKATQPWANVVRLATESGAQRQLANYLGAYRDGMISDLFGRFDTGEGLPGWASWFARKTMKISGFNFETDAHNAGITAIISHELAARSAVSYAELDPKYQRLLGAYDIGAAEWPRLAGAITQTEGRDYIVPQALRLEDFGEADTPAGRRSARRARDELAGKLMSFIDDRRAASIAEPGGRTKAILHGGPQPGTWQGELWRSLTQFKSFSTEMLVRVWGEKIAEGEYVKLAGFVLATTVLGNLITVVRDAQKGIAPPDYANLTAAQATQLFARGMITGGGFSILGDLVLGEYDRYGRDVLAQQAGPVLGQVAGLAGLGSAGLRYAGRASSGTLDEDDSADLGARAFKLAYQNTPFVNVWYLRTVFDYLLLYPMTEYLNPGHLRRMERKREQDTGQKYLLAPSGS